MLLFIIYQSINVTTNKEIFILSFFISFPQYVFFVYFWVYPFSFPPDMLMWVGRRFYYFIKFWHWWSYFCCSIGCLLGLETPQILQSLVVGLVTCFIDWYSMENLYLRFFCNYSLVIYFLAAR